MKNKISLIFALILCVGMVIGCSFSRDLAEKNATGDNNKNRSSKVAEKSAKRDDIEKDSVNDDDEEQSTDAEQTKDESATSRENGDLSAIVGKWIWARTGNSTQLNGVTVGGNGSRFTYEFFDDGTVEFTGALSTIEGVCVTKVTTLKKGKADLNDDELTLDYTDSSVDYYASCADDYQKTLPSETETSRISFKTNSTSQRLLCMESNGEENCFSPAQ